MEMCLNIFIQKNRGPIELVSIYSEKHFDISDVIFMHTCICQSSYLSIGSQFKRNGFQKEEIWYP